MNPRIWTLDLEYNQPSKKIIQIGVVIGDLHKGRILDTFNYMINPHETLNPYIIELTGITQAQVDNGLELNVAVKDLDARLLKYKACKSPIVWGNGDLRTLKSQSSSENIQGILREIDIKTIHQFLSLSQGLSMRGGLEKSIEKYGLKFDGRPHDALMDAKNTFYLAHRFHNLLKGLQI